MHPVPTVSESLRNLPRWYCIALTIAALGYFGGWLYAIHIAQGEIAAGAAYVLPVQPHDSSSYAALSNSLLHTGTFTQPGESHEYFATPGYPAFVAAIRFLTGGSFFAVTFVQTLLMFAVACMTYLLGARLVSPLTGMLASLLFLANPLVPSIAFVILTDSLFTFLLVGGITILVLGCERAPVRAALAAALLFAAAVYVRPVGVVAYPLFVAPLLAAALPWRKKLLLAVMMLVVISALLVPWMLRNKADSGVFGFSSLASMDFAYYAIPHYWNWQTGLPLDQGIARVEQESGVPRGTDANGYPANWYDLSSSPALGRYDKEVILRDPIRYTAWHLYNSTGFFLNPALNPPDESQNLKKLLISGEWGTFVRAATTPWWLFAERLAMLVGIVLLALGFWRLRRIPQAWTFALIILYLAAVGGLAAQARFRLPVEGLLALFMISGLMALPGIYRRAFRQGGV